MQIWMKFGTDVTPLGSTPKSYSKFPKFGNINIADERTCEVEEL